MKVTAYVARVGFYGGRRFECPFPTEAEARAWMGWITSAFSPSAEGPRTPNIDGVCESVILRYDDYVIR